MNDGYKIKPFIIILPKRCTNVKRYDGETKWIYFLIKDDECLKKYSDVWTKVSNSIKK